MLMTGHYGRLATGYFNSPETGPGYSISLENTLENDEICGKVQILSETGEYYAIVVELDCKICLTGRTSGADGVLKPERVIHLLAQEKGLNFIVNSSIYNILDGKEEALLKICENLDKYRKVFERTSYIYDFTFKLPYDQQLPSTWDISPHGNVEYNINLYIRRSAESGYTLLHHKSFNFYGFNVLPPEITSSSKKEVLEEIVSCHEIIMSIQLPRSHFLRRERIFFTVQIQNPQFIPIMKITANLLCKSELTCRDSTQKNVKIVDTFIQKKISKSDAFLVKGKFQAGKVKAPSYGEHPIFKIEYFLQCELTTSCGPINGELPLIIGTDRLEPTPSAPPGGAMSLASSSFSLFSMLPRPSAPPFEGGGMSAASSTFSLYSLHRSLPTYSQLPSREMSMLSLETLPPHYEDIEPDVQKESSPLDDDDDE